MNPLIPRSRLLAAALLAAALLLGHESRLLSGVLPEGMTSGVQACRKQAAPRPLTGRDSPSGHLERPPPGGGLRIPAASPYHTCQQTPTLGGTGAWVGVRGAGAPQTNKGARRCTPGPRHFSGHRSASCQRASCRSSWWRASSRPWDRLLSRQAPRRERLTGVGSLKREPLPRPLAERDSRSGSPAAGAIRAGVPGSLTLVHAPPAFNGGPKRPQGAPPCGRAGQPLGPFGGVQALPIAFRLPQSPAGAYPRMGSVQSTTST